MKDKDIRLDTSEGVLSSGFCVISFLPFPPLSLLPHSSSSLAGCAERRCNGLPQGSHLIGSHCPSRSEMAPTPSAWKKLFTMENDADFIVCHFPKEKSNGYHSTNDIGGLKIGVVSWLTKYQFTKSCVLVHTSFMKPMPWNIIIISPEKLHIFFAFVADEVHRGHHNHLAAKNKSSFWVN